MQSYIRLYKLIYETKSYIKLYKRKNKMQNPFTLSFGKKPLQYISRISQTNQIVETFRSENPANQLFMITGVRGSGKTVMMTNIVSEIKKDEEWLTVELNPTRDMLQSLAAKIYSMPQMNKIFVNAKLDFSAFGLGVSIENAAPVTDIENVLELMLENIKKHNKRLLISVDEVMNCEFVKVFVSSFQIFLRQDYPIFLLMTGLFENIYDLQNDKALTFLYRAPKIMLEPLSFTAVRKHYMDIFDLDQREADKMAALTKGYPFAFQVLGYLYRENRDDHTIEDILPEYDQCLDEYVYSKIWSELSELDKKILLEISVSGEEKVKEIREKLDMNSGLFSVYRDRLKRKGVIDTSEYGKITLTLPRFEEFVKTRQM